MSEFPLIGRVAVVSGANHGIGAATAIELARLGADVAVTFFPFTPSDDDPSRPEEYRIQREQDATATVAAVEVLGRRGIAIEADLMDPDAPARVFAKTEAVLGPVSILVNNASAWRQDTFAVSASDHLGRPQAMLDGETALPQLLVDARAAALMNRSAR